MTTPQRWKEIDSIFAAALEREPVARAAFLDEACAGDELLRKEVESLLANDIPESLVGDYAVQKATRLLEQRAGELPSKRIGRYQILRALGAGGMGRVYLGLDEQLNRQVAIKLLSNYDASDAERMRRFRQEAKAAAALNHPNIAHIYEIGEDQGTNFIAMEFVDGETLREKIRGKSELKILLKHLLQVAEGLAKAHAVGIVHRDLKPDNIMITRDGHAKILDFGLAKLLEPAGQKPDREGGLQNEQARSEIATAMMPVQHSTPGVVMGTVGYMSPEQAQAKPVDQRSDIFSFGCILYEAATGRKPFAGNSIIDTLHKIIYEPAPSITDLNPSASPELQRVIRKCLAKEPEKRYQTIRDTANDLEELIEEMKGMSDIERSVAPSTSATTSGTTTSGATNSTDDNVRVESTVSVSQPPPSSAQYIVSGIKHHTYTILVVFVTLIAVAGFLSYRSFFPNNFQQIESIAVMPFVNASGNSEVEYLSDGMTDMLITSLSQLPKLSVKGRSSVFRYKGRDAPPQQIGKELNVQAILNGRVVQRGNDITLHIELVDAKTETALWSGDYSRPMTNLLALQSEIARDVSQKLRARLSGADVRKVAKNYTESNEAYQLYLKGRFYWNKRTGEALKKAIEYFNQAIEKDPGFALAYAGLADGYVVPGTTLPPREKMPKAKAAAIRALELDETLAEAHASLARVLATYDWDFTKAEKEYMRAIELDPRYAIAHQWYGACLEVMGRTSEAIAERKQALELDPVSPTHNFSLGLAFYYARDYDQAIEQFQKTLELDQNFPSAHIFLPAAYEQKGMYDKAIAEFKNAALLRGGDEFPLAGLGHVYGVSGKKAEARAVLDELKEMSRHQYVTAPYIALVYAGLGEKDQAFAWLEKAYEERSFEMQWLKREPRWDSLRTDPRFADLVRRVGLPQ